MMAGAPSQLASLSVVRREPRKASTTLSMMAAGTPRKMALRKVNVSPTVTLAVEPGILIGYQAVTTTRLSRAKNCDHCAASKARHRESAHAAVSVPAATITDQ
jgi:hypothetical protein